MRSTQRCARVAAWQTAALGGGIVPRGSSYATATRMLIGSSTTEMSHSV